MRAVTAGEIRRFAGFLSAVGHSKTRDDTVAALVERNELHRSLDCNAEAAQTLDQQPLVLVLRKNDHVRKRADADSNSAEVDVSNLPTFSPQIDGGELESALNDSVGKTDLSIELERSRVDDERTRCRAGLGHFINDAHTNPQSREPQSKHEAGGSGAGDQDIGIGHARASRKGCKEGRETWKVCAVSAIVSVSQ